jgi:hypothetical protein
MEDFEQLNYYELLGVPPGASSEEIKRAYRQQIARYHPDRYANHTPAEQAYAGQRSQRINEAYRILSDFRQRQTYDRSQSIRPTRNTNTSWKGERETPRPAAPQPTAGRDHQAELYQQAQAHLKAGRYAQAAATLRQLQQINPFYRDSATLLAQAEAASQGQAAAPASPATAATAAGPERNRRFLLFGGVGVAVFLIGIITAVLMFRPGPATIAGNPGNVIPSTPSVAATASATSAAPTNTAAVAAAGEDARATATPVPVSPTSPPANPTLPPATATSTPIPASPTLPPATATPIPASPTLPPATATPVPASPTPLPPGPGIAEEFTPGELLLAYNFTTPDGWAQVEGFGWNVGSDGAVYRIVAQPGVGNIWSYRTAFIGTVTDFSVGVDLQAEGGTAGLMTYFVDGNNYLALLLTPQAGTYRIEQYLNGVPTTLAAGESDAIRRGTTATNRIVARMEGANVELFINGEAVAQATSDLAQTRLYGLIAIPGEGAVVANFDNLEIRALE